MPRVFYGLEQELIRERLIAAGKKQLASVGMRRLVACEVDRDSAEGPPR